MAELKLRLLSHLTLKSSLWVSRPVWVYGRSLEKLRVEEGPVIATLLFLR